MAVITISKEHGSCGEEVAREIASQLGYSYFDKEILAEVARTANTTEEKISRYDERDEHNLRTFLKQIMIPDISRLVELPYYYPPSLPVERSLYPDKSSSAPETKPSPKREEVMEFFRQVIEKLWKRGNVVIIGRGAQIILADKPDVLHVRIIGDINDRADRVIRETGVTSQEALAEINTIDKQRAHYLRHEYNADWSEPNLYHLVLNTSAMSPGQAVASILAAVRLMDEQ